MGRSRPKEGLCKRNSLQLFTLPGLCTVGLMLTREDLQTKSGIMSERMCMYELRVHETRSIRFREPKAHSGPQTHDIRFAKITARVTDLIHQEGRVLTNS